MIPFIQPVGVGDLKVTKQKLVRYEAGEIAHIENIMGRESRKRNHRHLKRVTETVTSTNERSEENTKDMQSTERFEMENESQRTLKSESSFNAGVDISASYGPVSINASTKFAMTDGKEEADKNATKYAKEVTSKSLQKIIEKSTLERQTITMDEYEEKNHHGFDNTAGSNPVVGVYRWVDKIYRNKVVDYGKRLMYEFYIPEPALFYLYASKSNLENKVLPKKPSEPVSLTTLQPLSPADISRYSYLTLLKKYNAKDVTPPPAERLVVSKAISREFPTDDPWSFSNEELDIPKGYEAFYGTYIGASTFTSAAPAFVIQVGINQITMTSHPGLVFDSEVGKMPISGAGYGIKTLAFNFDIICRLTTAFYQQWQIKVYTAIMDAYAKEMSDYEEKVAAAQIQQGVLIGGGNPLKNRQVEMEELKKYCISMWTLTNFNLAPAVFQFPTLPPPASFPFLIFPIAILESFVMEFFESSFEWGNMTYEFLPYYWGRQSQWLDSLSAQSNDPIFDSFLKAGAAKVRVPVKPSHTENVLFYQLTGVVLNGGTVPAFASADPITTLYNSYLQELIDVKDIPDIDADVTITKDDPDSWLTKIPTDLVWLQNDATLPNFEP
ncbi:MAG TPA: hypothetical protein VF487_06070 [Chitinophagaceae bacterium]